MKRLVMALSILLLSPATAFAGKCDTHVRKADTAKGAALVTAFEALVQCDPTEAETAFPAFMRAAGDLEFLVALSHVAIDAQVYTPVWNMLESVRDYGQRSDIAKGVGEGCGEHPQVVQFLQGAYYGLRDIQFVQWDDALVTCRSPELDTWMVEVVAAPPASSYDEKYAAVMDAYVKHARGEALPVLERAAIEAATNGGPFNAIIEKMESAVAPDELGGTIADEDRAKLEASLIAIAQDVGPEQAALVADRLFNAGSEDAAATLLTRVYPQRVQPGKYLLYGAAAIETCDTETYIHYVEVLEPSKRWSILSAIEEPLQAFKPKLRCDNSRPWPVVATAEPVRDKDEVGSWVDGMVTTFEGKGHTVKAKAEKQLILP